MLSPQDLTRSTYAFISHSPSTYPLHEPEIDNAPLARRKRRRTSANELQILYSEFNRCPKPSRHIRQEIAERVGMTEKAVQIWFQNRRQSSRRTAQQNAPSSPVPANMSSQKLFYPIDNDREPALSSTSSVTTSSSPGPESPISISFMPVNMDANLGKSLSASKPDLSSVTRVESISSSSSKGVLTPTNSSFANVMSMAAITNNTHASLPLSSVLSATPSANASVQPLGKAASVSSTSAQLRLTMSSDGKAHVVLETADDKENAPSLSETAVGLEYECVQNLLRLRSGTWS
ncbi:hypothetical protein V1512DRAFT_284912 [Lipomyces arxii]|uniref:uncharacterized protein n=1 Tax=Lipomyces arxii TaxID=56418 RepID=UPI0034CE2FDB